MLELKGVTAGYGRTMVLNDVSITVPTGGAVALMGHNGAGKTTLLRVAVGLIPVTPAQCCSTERTSPACDRARW